jgi:hypothetical protein
MAASDHVSQPQAGLHTDAGDFVAWRSQQPILVQRRVQSEPPEWED